MANVTPITISCLRMLFVSFAAVVSALRMHATSVDALQTDRR
jgi:hypothetical protein